MKQDGDEVWRQWARLQRLLYRQQAGPVWVQRALLSDLAMACSTSRADSLTLDAPVLSGGNVVVKRTNVTCDICSLRGSALC
jgi:hypothetical protein